MSASIAKAVVCRPKTDMARSCPLIQAKQTLVSRGRMSENSQKQPIARPSFRSARADADVSLRRTEISLNSR